MVELLQNIIVLTLLHSITGNDTSLIVTLYCPREINGISTITCIVLYRTIHLGEYLDTRVTILESSLDALVLPLRVVT